VAIFYVDKSGSILGQEDNHPASHVGWLLNLTSYVATAFAVPIL